MKVQVQRELVALGELTSQTLAKKLGVSDETGYFIMRMIDTTPEVREYYKTLKDKIKAVSS